MHFATAFVLFFSTALATPLVHHQSRSQTCSPNFEGAGVSVTNSAVEWFIDLPPRAYADVFARGGRVDPAKGIASSGVPDFRLEQTGQPGQPPSYIIKPLQDNNLVVNVRRDGMLYLTPFLQTDQRHNWKIACKECGTDASTKKGGVFSSGCAISSAVNGLCVQINQDSNKPMFLANCDGSNAQNFDFHVETKV